MNNRKPGLDATPRIVGGRADLLAGASRRLLWLSLLGLLGLLSVGWVGCGGPTNRPVDGDLARQTLVRALEHWQSGGEPSECQAWTPPVVVGHSRWHDGAQLTGFRLADERAFDSNLFVNVELQVNQAGRTETVTEQYCVSTNPVLTIFRTMQPAF